MHFNMSNDAGQDFQDAKRAFIARLAERRHEQQAKQQRDGRGARAVGDDNEHALAVQSYRLQRTCQKILDAVGAERFCG